MLWIIIIIVLAFIDQLTKYLVSINIEYGETGPGIGGFFHLTYHHNKGAAWGIFQDSRYFLITLTILLLVVLAYIFIKSGSRFLRLSLSIIIGGAVGNLIDRIRIGGVTDFLDFHFGSYHFPTFNFADICVVTGTFMVAWYMLCIYKGNTKQEE